MKFLFLTDTRIPSQRASAVHVRKLLPEFLNFFEETTLLSQAGEAQSWPEFPEKVRHEHIRLPLQVGGLYWMMLLFGKRMRKLSPDVIYSRFILLPLFFSKVPFVLELHDDAWNKGGLFRKALRKATTQQNCLGFSCITQAIKDDFQKEFPNCTKAVVVIEDAAANAPEAYQPVFRDTERLNLAYIGSFHKGKGLEQVVKLASLTPQHDFTIIGGSQQEIDSIISQGVTGNIHFRGYIDHDSIWKEMADIDVCLLPNQPAVFTGKKSNIGKYTSPLKMFEYMAFSKPIVASDLSVLKEVLDDSIARLVPYDDMSAWKRAIESLTDVEQRSEMGRKALTRFKEKFTWKRRADRISKFMEV